MGIEGFFKTLEKRKDEETGIITNFNKTDAEYLYIDFNSIVHNISVVSDTDLRFILAYIVYSKSIKNSNSIKEKIKQIAQKWEYDLDTATIENYKSYFTSELVDNYTRKFIKEHIINLLDRYLDSRYLKKIFLSMDGVPNMGKIIEQKQRKYMGYVSTGLNKKIFEKHIELRDISKERILFEETRIRFDRGKIVTWSNFMKKLEDELMGKEFINSLKKKFAKLDAFILSGIAFPGEGEKKIMEDIIISFNDHKVGNYMCYSPDADMILLTIILRNLCYINNDKESKFSVLHYDQQEDAHAFIDIAKFSKYISVFIQQDDREISITDEMIFNISNDFVMIANIFGNDFLPKIPSIDIKSDLDDILLAYKNMFINGKLNAIVIPPKDIHQFFDINHDNLLKFMQLIANKEDMLIRDKYLYDNYNISRIRKLLKTDETINQFVIAYIKEYGKFIHKLITKPDIPSIINEYKNTLFFKNLGILDGTPTSILERYKRTRRIPRPLYKIKKDKKSIDYPIKKYLEDPVNKLIYDLKGSLTPYDEDIILLDWKLGDYEIKLNSLLSGPNDVNFGIIDINFNNYQLYMPQIDRDYYYQSYLGVLPQDKKKKLDILREYLFGLIWTFDFYFNKNNKEYNLLHVSTWFYSYHRSPLLQGIVEYLEFYIKTDKVHHFNDKINENLIDRNDFLNRYEQLLYTVPKNNMNPIINGYQELLKNKKLFPDMDHYINEIWEGEADNYIDCRHIKFIAKCILKKVMNYSFNEFMSYVKPYRKYLKESNFDYSYVTKNREIKF